MVGSGLAERGGLLDLPAMDGKSKPGEAVLLSGGNPQIAKGYGDPVVQSYIAAMPGWKKDVGQRIDALVTCLAPGVDKVVKGRRTAGSSASTASIYVKVTFFRGRPLDPIPHGASKHPEVRYLDIR